MTEPTQSRNHIILKGSKDAIIFDMTKEIYDFAINNPDSSIRVLCKNIDETNMFQIIHEAMKAKDQSQVGDIVYNSFTFNNGTKVSIFDQQIRLNPQPTVGLDGVSNQQKRGGPCLIVVLDSIANQYDYVSRVILPCMLTEYVIAHLKNNDDECTRREYDYNLRGVTRFLMQIASFAYGEDD